MTRDKGQSAADLLENPVFLESLEDLEELLFRQWLRSKTTEEREKLHCEACALERVHRYVRATAEDLKK